ncbi:MAG: hypothetical protein K9H64_11570 [Bacteroidales bacterium]|nr:hypothetical protein [Bacteroidales bacterium]MCF8456630.1 hypothetical protein [Bacteroidales bacterium]
MKTLSNYNSNNNNILSIAELLMIKGGTSDEDPKDKDKEPKKKDEVQYPTIDGDFDYWPEPEV